MSTRGNLRSGAAVVVAATAAYVVWMQTEIGGARATLVFDDVITTVSPAVGAALCFWAARQLSGRTRVAYRFLGSACAAWGLGNLAWTIYEVHLDTDPYPSIADIGYLATIPLALVGLLALPGAPTRFRPTIRAVIDGLITAGALLFVGWELILSDVYRTSSGSTAEQVIGLAYPIGDIVLAVVTIAVLVRLPPGKRLAPALLGLGVLCLVVADMSFAYLTTKDSYELGNPYDTGWFAGFLVIGLAALAQTSYPPEGGRRSHAIRPIGLAGRSLPSLAAFTALLLATNDYLGDERVEPLLFWTALLIALLVVARQILSQSENAALLVSLQSHLRDLEASGNDLREAQRVAQLGSWRWDVVADRVTWSDELFRLFGLGLDELAPTYEGYLDQVDPADRDRVHRAVQRAFATGQPFEFDHRVAMVPGRIVHSRGFAVRDGDGEVTEMTGTAQDVTEVRRLAAELERRLVELERSNDDLARFASVASHDLKSPVQLIAGYLGMLEERSRSRGDDHDLEVVSQALRGTRRMRDLIDDILTYSMVASENDAPYVEVDLNAVFRDEATVLRKLVPGVDIEIGALPSVPGHPVQLRQLAQNLLSNAAKFVPPGRRPQIRVWAARNGAYWRISVTDNGVGVDLADRERVFQMFSRVGRVEATGTGIGLAICRRIVEGHGGRIWIETATSGGTDVSFTLPEFVGSPMEAPSPSGPWNAPLPSATE